MLKRTLLGAALLVGTVSVGIGSAPRIAVAQQSARTISIRNVVLVHGAWADGTGSWSKLIPLLEARGFNVTCVQNPLRSIADDVAATNRAIDAQDGPVLLVGHSYGGAVITEAGINPKVAGLVYVAAWAPDAGETLASLAQPFGATSLASQLRPIEDGYLVVTPEGVREDFAQDVRPSEQRLIIATEVPLQSAIFSTPITTAAWHSRPSWFVVAANDRAIAPDQERFTAKRMGARTITLPTSHVPMLAMPEEVAEFIEAAAE
jgi:pimeloyl-ACP methyl ester carboxylesterase